MLSKDKSRYLRVASASVLESSLDELILIEPGSSDNSRLVCAEIKTLNPQNVQLVVQSDISPADGLNHGLEKANNNIVGVLNADDFYLPGALNQVRFFFQNNPNIDLMLGAGFLYNEVNSSWRYALPSKITPSSLYFSDYGSLTFFHQGMFFRRDRFPNNKFNPNNRINWDKEFFISLIRDGARVGYFKNPLAIFRLNETSLTSSGLNPNQTIQLDDFKITIPKYLRIINPKLVGLWLRSMKWFRLVIHVSIVHFNSFKMRIELSKSKNAE